MESLTGIFQSIFHFTLLKKKNKILLSLKEKVLRIFLEKNILKNLKILICFLIFLLKTKYMNVYFY